MGVCIGLLLSTLNVTPRNVAFEITGGNEPGFSNHQKYKSENAAKKLV